MKYLQALYIDKGIITLIEDDGEIVQYKQKGIDHMCSHEIDESIRVEKLSENILDYRTLPDEYEIYFEDEEIMGTAETYFKY